MRNTIDASGECFYVSWSHEVVPGTSGGLFPLVEIGTIHDGGVRRASFTLSSVWLREVIDLLESARLAIANYDQTDDKR